jgi:hypothetical protein
MRPDRGSDGGRDRRPAWRRRPPAGRWDGDADRGDPHGPRRSGRQPQTATSDLDPELAALSAELAIAGARARAAMSSSASPSPAFAAGLRVRRLATGPVRDALDPRGPAGPAGSVAVPAAGPAIPSLFGQLAAPRWTALAAATVIVFASIGLTQGSSHALAPQAHLASTTATTIRRDGEVRSAVDGAAVEIGDVVSVAAGGEAVLVIGTSEARLQGGAAIQLDRLDPGSVALVQLAGRVYHRVDGPAGPAYIVRTASVTWTAQGAAFDVRREPLPGGGESATLLAVEGALAVEAADFRGSIVAGRRAVIRLDAATPDVAIGPIETAAVDDAWLAENARRDRDQGRPLGILETVTSP